METLKTRLNLQFCLITDICDLIRFLTFVNRTEMNPSIVDVFTA